MQYVNDRQFDRSSWVDSERLDFLFSRLVTTDVQFFWCGFLDKVLSTSEICSSGLLKCSMQLCLCFNQSPLTHLCALKTSVSHQNTWDLLGHSYTQVMQAQEHWLKLIYQLTSHHTSSPSLLAKTLALNLPLLCLPYFFHSLLELEGAVSRQFICTFNNSLVGYSNEPHGQLSQVERISSPYLRKTLISVSPSSSRYALNLNLENPFWTKPNFNS